jgi:hypothetical protein
VTWYVDDNRVIKSPIMAIVLREFAGPPVEPAEAEEPLLYNFHDITSFAI